ncbi:BLUF domain-containing protein [Mucilaginibacter sp. BJC16-A38]|uniref:BLUF domain-containing protein n=1 Tax=Mucilaginibacter phenanthrenivorans TaxID=1234842 RepID=UPI00215807C6|nr:BLUF domain-containing protein [Mucilaginibacter phenanthrenivorans]MCR8560930.1 BLUF domain-containing protein [Mucilaginibacter phenanthrenivorans]
MYFILYLSAGVNWFTDSDLIELLAACSRNNNRNSITGLLLYADGNFIQLLEGEEAAVLETYKKISLDERHRGITEIASGPLANRNFPEWAMGFKSIGAIGNTPFKKYLDPATSPANDIQDKHLAVKMLNAFIKTARM